MFKPTLVQEKLIENFREGMKLGVILAETSDTQMNGREIEVAGRKLVSFASCSYLGLELDERLIEGSVAAVRKYGTNFSTSRAYLQMGLYSELEERFEKIFGAPCLIGATTTLCHLSVFPSLITKRDAIIIDRQGHNSLQDAVTAMVGRKTHREIVDHNNMSQLRERIEKLSAKYDKVWYVADGVYSIYGDVAAFSHVYQLLEDFPKLIAYIDDAHGMGWAGKHGRGIALDKMGHHERLILATSLGKSLAVGGGAMVFPDQQTKELVRYTGKSLMFGGPLTPGQLGGALAVSEILLSDEITIIQNDLKERCAFFLKQAKASNLEIIDRSLTPIFYVAIGDVEILIEIAALLQQNHSLFVTPTGFPAVAKDQCGLRITITRNHKFEEISKLVLAISEEYDAALLRRGKTRTEFSANFIELPHYA